MIKKIRDEKGYSIIEFALVLPVMIIILGLIFDMGRAVHIKTNLQHLSGEIQKVVILYDEEGASGGIRTYSNYKNKDKIIEKLIQENKSLDKNKVTYKISSEGVKQRKYIGHNYSNNTGRFIRTENRNDIEYITTTVKYNMSYGMFVTRAILGDSIELSESYTGLMYAGGDGWD